MNQLNQLTTEQLQDLQIKRMEAIYAAHGAGDEVVLNAARAAYEETVQELLARLGENAPCTSIDQDSAQFFSDWYKEEHNFRPRGFTYKQMVDWMDHQKQQTA